MSDRQYIRIRSTPAFAEWNRVTFLRFFSHLSQDDWQEFLEDAVSESPDVHQIIPERQDGSVIPSIAILLRELPPGTTGERAARALAVILRTALRADRPTDAEVVRTSSAIRLADALPTPDVTDALVGIVSESRAPDSIRALAASTLAMPRFGQQLAATFWFDQDLQSAPFLLPAVVLAIQHADAKAAIHAACALEAIPDIVDIEYPLRMAVRSLFYQNPRDHNEVLDELIQESPSWLRRQLLHVLGFSEFARFRGSHPHSTDSWDKHVGRDDLDEILSADGRPQLRCVLGKYLLSGIDIAKQYGNAKLVRFAAQYRKTVRGESGVGEGFWPAWQDELFTRMLSRLKELSERFGCSEPTLTVLPPFEDNFQTMSLENESTLHRYFLAEPWFNDRAVRANYRSVVQFGVVKEMVAIADASTSHRMINCCPNMADVFSPESDFEPIDFKTLLDHCRNMNLEVCTPQHHASDNTLRASVDTFTFPREFITRRDSIEKMAQFITDDTRHRILLCDVGVAYQLLTLLTTPNGPYQKARAVQGIRVLYPRPLPVGFPYPREVLWSWFGGLIRECLDDVVETAIGEVQESLQVTGELLRVLRIDCDWPRINAEERSTHESRT